MPIDYSKWDKIDCSSSSGSEEDEEETRKAPRVTRLDTPSRVTRTKDGQLVVESIPVPVPVQEDKGTSAPAPSTNTDSNNPKWTENGSTCTTPSGSRLYWSQDRYCVTFRLELPSANVTAKDIQVQCQGILPYAHRSIAVGSNQPASILVTCQSRTLLQGEFPHPLHATEDAEHDNHCDWELDRVVNKDNPPVTYWVTTFQKATPMDNMVVWWRQPLQQFPLIESQQANPNHSTKQAQAFQQAWQQAHQQFREKTLQNKQQLNSID